MGKLGLILFLVGFLAVIIGLVLKRMNKRCSAQTQGILKGFIDTENADGAVGTSCVYSYSVNGVEYQIKSGLSKEAHNIGDSCTIWYDPKKPKVAQPVHYESTTLFNLLIIGGILMFLVGFVLMVVGI